MKILLVLESLKLGGTERVASGLANSWARRGHLVTLLTFADRESDFYELDGKVNRIYLDSVRNIRNVIHGFVVAVKLIPKIRKVVNDGKADVVISFLPHVNVITLLALFKKTRVVATEHGHPPAYMYEVSYHWRLLRLLTYWLADKIVALTPESSEWIRTHIPFAKVKAIPNPYVPLSRTPPEIRPNNFLKEDQKLLLSAGRLSSEKGFDILIRAFFEVSKFYPEWVLVILGEGEDEKKLRDLIATLGLKSKVLLPGKAGNMEDWYRRADLFAMSSRHEGFPMVLLEAMAFGCPCISFDCDVGPRNIIRNGIDGRLVRPTGDGQALAKAMAYLMENTELRARLGARAPEVKKRFSMEKILAMWDDLFKELGLETTC